jgi:succinate-semialdehyde dehydrogenase/glutarate-semialdehyde dehydrogenase
MDVINLATGEQVDTYEEHTQADVDHALDIARTTFSEWRDRPMREREDLLARAAEVLRENEREYAETITREMGKPIEQSVAEVEKCAWGSDHYAEHAGAYLADEHHASPPGASAKTVYQPLGPVLAVMPWNFPFWQVFRFAAPYLTAGNVGLLKHASNVPGCALAIEEVFREAGYPEGVFQSLLIPSDLVDDVIEDERVRAATLTGSNRAGKAVAASAGEQLKKTVLELGGSDPFVVLDDADVDRAAAAGTFGTFGHQGQVPWFPADSIGKPVQLQLVKPDPCQRIGLTGVPVIQRIVQACSRLHGGIVHHPVAELVAGVEVGIPELTERPGKPVRLQKR